jgi:nicotinamide-nucleotide amidase
MNDALSIALATELGALLSARGWRLTTAESCTGGLVAAAITSVPGSSGWFDEGFVTYGNAAKASRLGVAQGVLAAHGAVSEASARAMAEGALRATEADLAVAVTGVAGPGGGTPDKPVGLVWLAWAKRDAATRAASYRFAGDRAEVRSASVVAALEGLLELVREG